MFRENFTECDVWCVLEVDPVCLQKEGVVFTTGNAASSYVREHGTAEGIDGLRAMFSETVMTGNRSGRRMLSRTGCAPSDPTDIQAEILFPAEIPLEQINALVFETNETRARGKAALETNDEDIKLPPLVVRPEDFGPRPTYER